jgi:hypothetical protein
MVSDAMYMRTLPLGIRGTEGDLRLLPKDFGHDGGAARTAVLELGVQTTIHGPHRLYCIRAERSSSSFGVTTKAGAGSLSIVERTTNLTPGLTLA